MTKKQTGPAGNPFQVVAPAKGCRYPIGDPREASFRFCEKPHVLGRSYCADHLRRCYEKPARKKKPKDLVELSRPSKQTRRKPMGRLEAALNG